MQFEIGRLKGKAQDVINTVVSVVQAPAAPLVATGTAVIDAYTDAAIVASGYRANGIEGAKAAARAVSASNKAAADRKIKALVRLIPGVREVEHSKRSAAAIAQGNYQLAGAEQAHVQTAFAEDLGTVMAVGGLAVGTAARARSALSFESAAAAGAEGLGAGMAESIQMLQPQIARVSVNAQRGAAFERQLLIEAHATRVDVATQLSVRSLGTQTRTKLDLVGRDPVTSTIMLMEGKSSSTAPLTSAQAIAFPDIAANGAVVIGKGKPGYPPGTVIPPTSVVVRRP